MLTTERRQGRAALFVLSVLPIFAGSAPIFAGLARADQLDPVVVTAYRSPTEISQSGSDISVIDSDQLARFSGGTIVDVLRQVPGVSVAQSGGPGASTDVYIRGANPGHTLVLIDGVRVNDPSSASGTFDFATFSPSDIERIEVLKGPQSALYGSDAMGGVINIITKKRTGKLSATASVEGGSYGTASAHLAAGGSVGPTSLSVSGTGFTTDGFSRVGNRDDGEADGSKKLSGTAHASYDSGDGPAVDFGVTALHMDSDTDAGSKASQDLPGYERKRDVVTGFMKFDWQGLDDKLDNQLNFFATDTTSSYIEPVPRTTDSHGTDFGTEYQGTYTFNPDSSLLFGARAEQESGRQETDTTASSVENFEQDRTLLAAFAMQQFNLFDRLNLSFGGRYDEAVDGAGFLTGRTTAAYRIDETGTKFRASFGNAAKRPTLFQLYDAPYANPDLQDETSFGGDAGIDQSLFDGRLTLSGTVFYNRFKNLINFDTTTYTYVNIGRARTQGVELSAETVIVPSILKATASYTYLDTENLDTGLELSRRPQNSGALTLTYTGLENFNIGLTATFVGDRANNDASTASAIVELPAYTKLDLNASYQLNKQTQVYGRIENLTDVTYQDAYGYNNAGLSGYVGLTWTH